MSNKSAIKDLTQGNMMKNMLVFSMPMLIGNVLQNLYNWVDSAIVGNTLGKGALAAVSISFPIIFIMISVILGLTMATSILISQYAGANNVSMIKKTISTTTIFLGVVSLIVSIIGVFFSGSFLRLINTPPEIYKDAQSYLVIIMIGLVFMFGYNMTSAVLRGLGDSKTPTVFLAIATLLNVILDVVLVMGVGPISSMGTAGAALATVIAQGVSYILSVIYLSRKGHLVSFKPSEMTFDKEIMLKIIKLGIPSAVQQFIVSSGLLVLSGIINIFGEDVIAAFGAGSKIDSFAMLPAMTLSLTASAMTGQCIGAGKKEKVKEVLKNGTILSLTISLATVAFVYTIGRLPLYLFTKDTVVVNIGITYLRIVSLSYVFLGMNFLLSGILRGAGDVWINMLITALSFFGIRIPVAYYLSHKTALGSTGIWIGIAVSFTLACLMNGGYYATGRWKRREVIKRVQVDANQPQTTLAGESIEEQAAISQIKNSEA